MLQSISTKTGDTGESSLANGERVPKTSLVFELIGTVDELNSWLGLVVVQLRATSESQLQAESQFLLSVQDTLFYLGAEIARSPKAKLTVDKLKLLEQRAEALQISMAEEWHTQFLLPGGTELGAQLDIARTVCRRCERTGFRYGQEVELSPLILNYLNRLSDYLYLLRCHANHLLHHREHFFAV